MRRQRPALAESGEVFPVVRKRRAVQDVPLTQAMHRGVFRAYPTGGPAQPGLCLQNPATPQRHHPVFEDAGGGAALEVKKMDLLFNPAHR